MRWFTPVRKRADGRSRAMRSAAELVKLLADPDAWWRETAQRLLFERQDRSVVPALQAMVAEAAQCAWAGCTRSGRSNCSRRWTPHSIELGLADPEPRVREAAIRLAEARLEREPALLDKTLALADDPDPMVRFQLAFSLGEVKNDPRVIEALASIARKDAASQWTRTAVLSSIAGPPLAFLDALAKRDGFIASGPAQVWIDELAFLVGCGRKPDDAKGFLDRLRAAGVEFRRPDACVTGAWSRPNAAEEARSSRWSPQTHCRWRRNCWPRRPRLAVTDGPGRRTGWPRSDCLAWATRRPLAECFPSCLTHANRRPFNLAVLQAMAGFLDRSAAGEILDRWKAMSPSVRREAVEVLFSRPEGIEALLGAIESRSLAPSEIDLARLHQLETHSNPGFRSRAQKILASGAVPSRDRAQVVASLSAGARNGGQPRAGPRGLRQGLCDVPSGRGPRDRRRSEPGDRHQPVCRKTFSSTSWTRTARWLRTS